MTRSVSCWLHRNTFIYIVYMKFVRNVSYYIIQIHQIHSNTILHAWSRLVELPSSDEMEMFYTEHDFQVDLENLRVQLEISCKENATLLRSYYEDYTISFVMISDVK